MSENLRFVYVDCTNTVFNDLNTGIQRVVKNIISRCPVKLYGVEFVPVFAYGGRFYRYPSTESDPLLVTKVLSRFLGDLRNALDRLFAVVSAPKKDCTAAGRESPALNRETVHSHIITTAREIVPFILRLAFAIDSNRFDLKEISIANGDIVFVPDAFWDPALIDALKKSNNSGAVNILLIHDLFPLLYPQLVDEGHVDDFMRLIPYVFAWADGVMSVSSSSLDEIRKYAALLGASPEYDYFHPGADLNSIAESAGSPRAEILKFFEGSATYLMVGTVEPRKNHKYVLGAFEKLWNRGEPVRLCIIGKIGWKCIDVINEINSSPHLNLNLLLINDANDSELTYCYTHAKATIVASLAEGFGLPLVEALHYGSRVFASDIPVFRETGKDAPIFFSLDTTDSLMEKILAFQRGCPSIAREDFVAQSWDSAVNDLFRKIITMSTSIRARRVISESET